MAVQAPLASQISNRPECASPFSIQFDVASPTFFNIHEGYSCHLGANDQNTGDAATHHLLPLFRLPSRRSPQIQLASNRRRSRDQRQSIKQPNQYINLV